MRYQVKDGAAINPKVAARMQAREKASRDFETFRASIPKATADRTEEQKAKYKQLALLVPLGRISCLPPMLPSSRALSSSTTHASAASPMAHCSRRRPYLSVSGLGDTCTRNKESKKEEIYAF